ncbi:MAG TPA: hypothetical protein VF324_06045 [Methanobacterium sp.]
MVLTSAVANILAGQLSSLYPDPTYPSQSLLGFPINSFTSFFLIFVLMSIIAALILLIIKKRLETMMHGIK